MKTLIVIDMQNDFITGPLGTPEAVAIVSNVKKKIEEYRARYEPIIFTRDCHRENYLETKEGRYLPVEHCIIGSKGWKIADGFLLKDQVNNIINKDQFGFDKWFTYLHAGDKVEIVGLCTDICVVSNALIIKAQIHDVDVTVDASCCAGTTPENHKAALQVMKSCQINVIGE